MAFVKAGLWGPQAIIDSTGHPQPGATATVYLTDGVTLASLWTSSAKSVVMANPTQADVHGNLHFWTDPGPYMLKMLVGTVVTWLDVEVPIDPGEAAQDQDVTAAIATAEAYADGAAAAALAAALAGSQPLDADLTAIAALSTTAYGRAFLALADAAAGRTALGLGTAATHAVGDFDAAGAAAAAAAALVNSAPGTLDTLNELATALADDPAFATTMTNALAGKQPLDADLTAIAALSTTAFGRSALALADSTALRVLAGTVIGTDVQAHDSDLDAIAALATTAFGRALLVLADAAALRAAAGLGTAATAATTDFDAAGTASAAITALINGAPGALDTLNELATALGDDAAFATTVTNALATKLIAGATSGTANQAALPAAVAHTHEIVKTDDGGVYVSTGSSWVQLVPPAGTYAPASGIAESAVTNLVSDLAGKSPILVPTAVKTSNYTAAAGDLVLCDTSGGIFTVTLPTAPADKTSIAVDLITSGNTLTIARGGADVFQKAAGPTSLTMNTANRVLVLQYQTATAVWHVQDHLPAIITTKGDLLTYSTERARLGVGTDGQVLTADSAQTLGIGWVTANANLPIDPTSSIYGFTGDGTSADLARLVTAVAAAISTKRGLRFPAGAFTINLTVGTPTITLTDSFRLSGAGIGKTVITVGPNQPTFNARLFTNAAAAGYRHEFIDIEVNGPADPTWAGSDRHTNNASTVFYYDVQVAPGPAGTAYCERVKIGGKFYEVFTLSNGDVDFTLKDCDVSAYAEITSNFDSGGLYGSTTLGPLQRSKRFFRLQGSTYLHDAGVPPWTAADDNTPQTIVGGVTTDTSTTITTATAQFTVLTGTRAAKYAGARISGAGIPLGATIVSVASDTSATISAPATASASGITFSLIGNGDSTGLGHLAYIHPNLSIEVGPLVRFEGGVAGKYALAIHTGSGVQSPARTVISGGLYDGPGGGIELGERGLGTVRGAVVRGMGTGLLVQSETEVDDCVFDDAGVSFVDTNRPVVVRFKDTRFIIRNWRERYDAAIVSGQVDLTLPTTSKHLHFTASDVGRVAVVYGAAAAGGNLIAKVATFVDTGHVTLDTAAGTSVTGARHLIGRSAAALTGITVGIAGSTWEFDGCDIVTEDDASPAPGGGAGAVAIRFLDTTFRTKNDLVVNIASGAATITVTQGVLSVADLYRTVEIQGAGSAGANLQGTITALATSTSATLSLNASTTVTGAKLAFPPTSFICAASIPSVKYLFRNVDIMGVPKSSGAQLRIASTPAEVVLENVRLSRKNGNATTTIDCSVAAGIVRGSNLRVESGPISCTNAQLVGFGRGVWAADIASGATLKLPCSVDTARISGTATINNIYVGSDALDADASATKLFAGRYRLIATGAWLAAHNAGGTGNIRTATAADETYAAGDQLELTFDSAAALVYIRKL